MKAYFLDTSVILDSPENIFVLSDKGDNIIVISDIVLNELDTKKTGFEVINYNAREFNRFSEQASVESTEINEVFKRVIMRNGEVVIHLVSLVNSKINPNNTDIKIINDRKIIENASVLAGIYDEVILLSNDIAFRTTALLEGLTVESFKNSEKDIDTVDFVEIIEVQEDLNFPCKLPNIKKESIGVEIFNTMTGNRTYVYRNGVNFYEIDDSFLQKQNLVPINIRQKIASSVLLDDLSDIFVISGASGSGKNSIVLSACCALMDNKNSPYDQIIYIRKTVTSVDNKQEELGYLPGDLNAKMGVYIKPLLNTVQTLVKRKYKNNKIKTKEELELKVEEFISKYNITFEYEGFLRGSTLSENSLIILDEFQNDSINSLRLTLSRVGKNSRVYILGDINQIDNNYVNKYNNALSYMLSKCGMENDFNVRINGMLLTETVRSAIAKFADSI